MKQGLVIENISNLYKVKCDEIIYNCNARGKVKKEDISPVVGDIVELDLVDIEKKTAVIHKIQERKNYIKRPKVSNISQLVLVISCKSPKPDLLMLDKQLAFAEYLNIKPIIVLNKIDLANKEIEKIQEVYSNVGYKVILTNAKTKQGIDKLEKELKGKISAFSGNSGVGKSTLINSIFKENITQEGIISKKNNRGKNTTTQVKLYEIEKDSYIMDTPGFSTFYIYEIEAKELEKYFVEFVPYIKNCEFVGCTHIKEENCGIKQAIEQGQITTDRYERYKKIYLELKDREEHKW